MIIFRLFVFLCLLSLSGCSGCSKSGREHKRRNSEINASGVLQSRQVSISQEQEGRKRPSIDSPNITQASSLSRLYEKNKKGVFLVFSTNDGESGAQGSGFFISPDGLGISNQHVFEGFAQHFIKLYDGTVYEVVEILRLSQESELDYVIFRINLNGNNVTHLKVAPALPVVGENVFTIGNPKGFEQTLSEGIVSGFRDENRHIQTTAEITNGSSGGPLFNMKGEVVGVTTSGVGEANLNFAINIHMLNL